MIMAKTVSSIVGGSFSMICGRAGARVRSESPRSPRSNPAA